MEKFMGFEITQTETGFAWAYSEGYNLDTIEDVQADILDYISGEEDAAMERRSEDAMERELMGE